MLRKTKSFLWDEAYEQAFLAFKKTIATLPVLSRPRLGIALLLYLLIADEAISFALVQEERKHRIPIYLTSCMLHDAEKCYQMIEKVALAFITSAQCLKPYFQSHQVVVKTNYPIKQVLRKPEMVGRIVAWSIEISEFDLQYKPCGPMKTQFMAYFLAEFAGNNQTTPNWWSLYVDDVSNLEGPSNVTLIQALKQSG